MKFEFLTHLACPYDGGHPLAVAGSAVEGDELVSGNLVCPSCDRTYQIVDGIPDLCQIADQSQIAKVKHQEIAARDDEVEDYSKLFNHYRNQLEASAVVKRLDLQAHHRVLELGCGTGRFTQWLSGMCVYLIAVDYSLQSLSLSWRWAVPSAPFLFRQAHRSRSVHKPLWIRRGSSQPCKCPMPFRVRSFTRRPPGGQTIRG